MVCAEEQEGCAGRGQLRRWRWQQQQQQLCCAAQHSMHLMQQVVGVCWGSSLVSPVGQQEGTTPSLCWCTSVLVWTRDRLVVSRSTWLKGIFQGCIGPCRALAVVAQQAALPAICVCMAKCQGAWRVVSLQARASVHGCSTRTYVGPARQAVTVAYLLAPACGIAHAHVCAAGRHVEQIVSRRCGVQHTVFQDG